MGSNGSEQLDVTTATVAQALKTLGERLESDLVVSRFYRTPAFPIGAGPDFINAAASFDWAGQAQDLLALLHQIEAEFGRTRTQRWEARVLDLDLLALGARVLPDVATQDQWRALPLEDAAQIAPDELILPHPRLQERGFVLVPLADIAPNWCHPRLGLNVQEMLAKLPAENLAEIRPIDAD